jgi:hypothetical protein
MNVLTARVAFRDRSLVDVLDLALRFIVVHGRAFAKVAAVVLLPSFALSWLAASLWGWGAGWAVAFPAGLLSGVPFTLLGSRLVFEEKVHAGDVLRAAARDLPRIAVMRVGWALLVLVAFFLFFVPAIWAASAFFFLDEVALLERASLTGSFGRAQRIAASSIGEALLGAAVLAAIAVLAVVLADVAGRTIIGELLQFRPPQSALHEGGSVLCLAGWFAAVPYLTTARLFTYLNVRTRAEGWDIQTRFAALVARSEA